MAKYCGIVGFMETVETSPGVWTEQITERKYYGDLVRNRKRFENVASQINENLNIQNEFSIVSDPYANQNFHQIRYVEYMGTKWKVTSVDVQFPRLTLSVGGVYNGEIET